jgi:hypothetical protein
MLLALMVWNRCSGWRRSAGFSGVVVVSAGVCLPEPIVDRRTRSWLWPGAIGGWVTLLLTVRGADLAFQQGGSGARAPARRDPDPPLAVGMAEALGLQAMTPQRRLLLAGARSSASATRSWSSTDGADSRDDTVSFPRVAENGARLARAVVALGWLRQLALRLAPRCRPIV